MVALPRRQRLNLPLAPLAAGAFAALVALTVALLPTTMLGNLVLDSGIVALVPAAEPPLGITARAALILIGGGGIGLIAWFALFLLVGTRSIAVSRNGDDAAPTVRHADAHPDAPPRRPLFANRDLGTPFLDVRAADQAKARHVEARAPREIEDAVFVAAPPVERPLPVDLDAPLSAFDPQAIPADPLDWFPPPVRLTPPSPPKPQLFDPAEGFETFELTPAIRETPPPQPKSPPPKGPPPAPKRAPDPGASIHALLDRLERSVAQRVPEPPREEGLRESLESLRRLATNG